MDSEKTVPQGTLPCKMCGGPIPVGSDSCPFCKTSASYSGIKPVKVAAEKNKKAMPKSKIKPKPVVNAADSASTGNAGSAKNKWTALFLCVLLGYFGAHKFYEGKWVMGVVYLFTCGLALFGWVYDILHYLFMHDTTYYV